MGLKDSLTNPAVKENVITDCRQLMDEQVAAKKGLGGIALKAAYSAVKGISPGYLSKAVDVLLPEICAALNPMWQAGADAGNPAEHLVAHKSEAADQILGITDARIERSKNKVVRGAYGKLRKSVKGDVEAAIPGLANIIKSYA